MNISHYYDYFVPEETPEELALIPSKWTVV